MKDEQTYKDSLLCMSWKEQVMYLATNKAEDRILRALIRTKSVEEWEKLRGENTPRNVYRAIETLYWEQNEFAHRHKIKEQPKYRPFSVLMRDYHGTGKRQEARKEMQIRLRYMTPYEQKRVLYAFMDSDTKVDRDFACKYLDKYYDPQYQLALETIWELRHDFEAAKVITHYASDEYVSEHFDELAKDYRYLPVRLRMPSTYPVVLSQLEYHEYIYLCARQHLPITEHEAFVILSNTINRQLIRENMTFEGASLLKLTYLPVIVWSLGELGFKDILMRLYIENERTKSLFRHGDRDAVREAVSNAIYEDGFYYFRNQIGTKEDVEEEKLRQHFRDHPEDFEE